MPSRREFIQAGLAASVAPVAFPIGGAGSLAPQPEAIASMTSSARPNGPALPLYCVVCDMRSRWSCDLAREAGRLGVTIVRTNGDITEFWYGDLAARWRRSPVAIAGLTGYGALFCLERFGWDHGLRVVFRGTHRLVEPGVVDHAIEGPIAAIGAAERGLARVDWPCHVAHLLSTCAATPGSASTTVRGAATSNEHAGLDDTLFSWVIASKHAVAPSQSAS